MPGCPIRISADRSVCARPRSFSQLITSFIASESLGIPHTPLCSLLYFLSFNEFATSPWLVNQDRLRFTRISSGENIRNIFYVSFFNMSMNVFLVRKELGQKTIDNIYFLFSLFHLLKDSGEYRSRTDDLLRARQAL